MYTTKRIALYIKGLLWIFVSILQPALLPAQTSLASDTLITRIQTCRGEEKLEAYAEACRHAATQNNHKDEFHLLRAYQTEAARQRNAEHETQARTYRLYAFYNNNLPDSLNAYIDNDLQFMSDHKQWVSYYSCRSLRVERLQYDNKQQSALREARAMYDYAVTHQTLYGKGISAYLIASCYQSMGRNEEAADFFGQAEMVCLLARAHAYTAKNNLPEARRQLDHAVILAQGQRDIARLMLLKEEALYEEAAGNYRRALEHLDERYRIQKELNNRLSAIETQEMRAHLLVKLGQHEDATQIYTELLFRKDSLSRMDLAAQLDDLGMIYRIPTAPASQMPSKLVRMVGASWNISINSV